MSVIKTIAAHIGVKNDCDLIPGLIDHLRAIGVDRILVTDINSDDGTKEYLQSQKSNSLLVQFVGDDCLGSQAGCGTTWHDLTLAFCQQSECDWILFLDADEFPILLSDDIHSCIPDQSVDRLILKRFNVPVSAEHGPLIKFPINRASLAETWLIERPIRGYRKKLILGEKRPWIFADIVPKVMARMHCIHGIQNGCHDVVTGTVDSQKVLCNDLIIAHLPLTTLARARRKARDVNNFFKRENSDIETKESWVNINTSWHWRRLALLERRGLTDQEFESNILTEADLNTLKRKHIVSNAADLLGRLSAIQ